MEVVLQFLDVETAADIRKLPSDSQKQAIDSIALVIRKNLMSLIQKNKSARIVEITEISELFDDAKCRAVLYLLSVDYDAIVELLHSEEILNNLVFKSLETLKDWGKTKTAGQQIKENETLHSQAKHMLHKSNKSKKLKSTNSAFVKETSSANSSFAQLNRVQIADLNLFTTHKGKFLAGKLVGKPVVTTGVTHLLQDSSGNCVVLGIYNMSGVQNEDQFLSRFPNGSLVAIKEPYYKVFDNGDRGIRIDDPSDLQIFSESTMNNNSTNNHDLSLQNISQSLNKIKQEGNSKFVLKQFEEAASCYKQLLLNLKPALLHYLFPLMKEECTRGEDETLVVKLGALVLFFEPGNMLASEVYSQNLPKSGLKYDEKNLKEFMGRNKNSSSSTNHNEKSAELPSSVEFLASISELGIIFSNLSACYLALYMYEEAVTYCELALVFPLAVGIQSKCEYRRATCNIMSGHAERVNINQLKSTSLSKSLVSSIETLIGQANGVHDWDSIIDKFVCDPTTPLNLPPYTGDIVFEEIAGKGMGTRCRKNLQIGELIMVSGSLAQEERRPDTELTDFAASDIALTGPQAFLARSVLQRAKQDIALRYKVRALYAGSKFSRVAVDQTRCPYLPCILPAAIPQTENDITLAPERVGNVIKYNAFGGNKNIFEDTSNSTIAGLFLQPSMLNHDENPNVSWVILGNTLVARAIRPIPAGTELSITYSCELRYYHRKKALENYGFPFKCPTRNPEHIAEAAEKSEAVSRLKEQANACSSSLDKEQILKRARKLNNSIITTYSQYFDKMSPILLGFLYDKMDLNLGLGSLEKAKHCIKVMLATFPGFVNEDLLRTIVTSFPELDLELRMLAEEVTRWMYGSSRLLHAFTVHKKLTDVSEQQMIEMAQTLYKHGQIK